MLRKILVLTNYKIDIHILYIVKIFRDSLKSFTFLFRFFFVFFQDDILSLVKNYHYKIWGLPNNNKASVEEFEIV